MTTATTGSDPSTETTKLLESQKNDNENISYARAFAEGMIILLIKVPFPLNIWIYCLITIHVLAFYYLPEIEAIAVLGGFLLAPVIMTYIYKNHGGMVRLAGLMHLAWLGIIPWLIYRLHTNGKDYYEDDTKPTLFYEWVIVFTVISSISTVLDIRDVLLWYQGNREPTLKIE